MVISDEETQVALVGTTLWLRRCERERRCRRSRLGLRRA
jgi:hypothetical protein